MTKAFIVIAVAFALTGCGKPAEKRIAEGGEFNVEQLFTVDGCTVYRFSDYGNARYFTNCKGNTNWSESCGKSCIKNQEIDGGMK